MTSKGLIEKYGYENFISGTATDHYNRFREDFKLAKDLGHNATRFSIEWSRIEPKEGRFDQSEIEHYKQIFETLHKLGIEPFVTLWHWTLPTWLSNIGGWENKKSVEYFVRYVNKINSEYGKYIKFWITINEPEIYSGNSYIIGLWPPQKKNPLAYFRVLHNLVKAHCKAYSVIKIANPQAQIGIAKNNIYFEAYKNRSINRVIKKVTDWWWNSWFLDQIANCQDFIGLNHYFYKRLEFCFTKAKGEMVSDMGWDLEPKAIYHVLKDLKKFGKPVYITENGLADASDTKRAWYIEESLKNIRKAMEEGVDVRGYLHWSLIDNFEWHEGFWPRFGLIGIDYKTMERKIRPSAEVYRDIIYLPLTSTS